MKTTKTPKKTTQLAELYVDVMLYVHLSHAPKYTRAQIAHAFKERGLATLPSLPWEVAS